jgi:hypothetical protein
MAATSLSCFWRRITSFTVRAGGSRLALPGPRTDPAGNTTAGHTEHEKRRWTLCRPEETIQLLQPPASGAHPGEGCVKLALREVLVTPTPLPSFADYSNSQNFILHYADMVDSTSLTNLLKYVVLVFNCSHVPGAQAEAANSTMSCTARRRVHRVLLTGPRSLTRSTTWLHKVTSRYPLSCPSTQQLPQAW